MSDAEAKPVPWLIFERRNRSNSVIKTNVSYPEALERGAKALGLKPEACDYAVVIPGESADDAKARVAGSIG